MYTYICTDTRTDVDHIIFIHTDIIYIYIYMHIDTDCFHAAWLANFGLHQKLYLECEHIYIYIYIYSICLAYIFH